MHQPSGVPIEYLQSLAQTAQCLWGQFTRAHLSGGRPAFDPSAADAFSKRLAGLTALQQRYARDMSALWAALPAGHADGERKTVASPANGDRRFAAAEWREQPFFNFLKQSYLIQGFGEQWNSQPT